jgi:hypothetical protein
VSTTLFRKVDWSLSGLIEAIDIGTLGLPDIQRPFIWPNTKVRDLFDSMFKGFPVGYFLFWATIAADGQRPIGPLTKQKVPQLLIVDGQQRLTSLYAVLKGAEVLRANFKRERIQIAFRPKDGTFDVADAAIRRDPEFIPDISQLWATPPLKFVNRFLENLRQRRDVSDDEEDRLSRAIDRAYDLRNYPFTALELAASADEEQVAEVFVRVNSTGTPLNQADFILTLMSVFWDQGRIALENFARESREPSTGKPSPFNYFLQPDPDQLLRVSVALGFRRARLQYVYSILRGKDLETGEVSEERRVRQFGTLAEAQAYVLDVQNWHEFMKVLVRAGFRSGSTITSKIGLLYAYAFFLIGKRDFGVGSYELRNAIARWFFMTALTGRYTSSPETVMDQDLARLREVRSGSEFIAVLDRIISETFTGDYWAITLPSELATSSPRSPSLFAYYAALNLLDARALFSKLKVHELLDPSAKARKTAVERHHLFPRAYLNKLGIRSLRDTNQIANFALVEWPDNVNISDSPPSEYWPKLADRLSPDELDEMVYWHALPPGWESMTYEKFVGERRRLMANVVKDAFIELLGDDARVDFEILAEHQAADPGISAALSIPSEERASALTELIARGESATLEFKSSARWSYQTNTRDRSVEEAVVKTVAGFMNARGGTVLLGVSDDGDVLGLEPDYSTVKRGSRDAYENWLTTLLEQSLGKPALIHLSIAFHQLGDLDVCRIDVEPSQKPVYTDVRGGTRFYVRLNNSTRELSVRETVDYIEQWWGRPPTAQERTLAEDEPPVEEPEVSGLGADSREQPELEDALHHAMVRVYERARKEAGYTATRFIQMVSEVGGLQTARALVNANTPSDGFTALWEKGRLDLAVENLILQPQFRQLFTDEERERAERRLLDYRFTPTIGDS